jgi:hypothetical protein
MALKSGVAFKGVFSFSTLFFYSSFVKGISGLFVTNKQIFIQIKKCFPFDYGIKACFSCEKLVWCNSVA